MKSFYEENFQHISQDTADIDNDVYGSSENVTSRDSSDAGSCISTFDLTRMDNVTPFSVSFVFQGKSWYTKWLTGNSYKLTTKMSKLLTRIHVTDSMNYVPKSALC